MKMHLFEFNSIDVSPYNQVTANWVSEVGKRHLARRMHWVFARAEACRARAGNVTATAQKQILSSSATCPTGEG